MDCTCFNWEPSPYSPHFTHLEPDGLLTEMETQDQLSRQHPPCHNNAPRHQSLFPSGVGSRHQPTWLHNCICMELITTEQRERQWQRAYRRRPTALETQEKSDRDRSTPISGNSLRMHGFPGCQFPVKFGCQPIKLELCLLVHKYPANYVSVHCRHLRVYKESQVAYRAIRVRVSQGLV